ncbi:MAG: response regulator [Lachnospiraceae bacterium]|nr:response regulator [Lachnospiraceae bacterium]MCI9253750.1 response regulator [Lachnospiraceae bacterium]
MNEYPTDSNIIEYMLTLLNISDHADGDPDFLSTIGNLKAASSVQPLPAMLEEHSDHVPNGIIRFMNQMPGGFFIYHADDKEQIIYVNQALLRIFQCETAEEFRRLTGNSFKGMVHPEDLAPVEESIRKQIAQSKYDLDYVEYRIIRRDGEIRWIEDYGHFVHSQSIGDIFYVFISDATEKRQRQLTEQHAMIKNATAENELKLRTLIESYDEERRLIYQEHLRRLEVIEGLSINYESILYVDLDSDTILPYRLSVRTEQVFQDPNRSRGLRWYTQDYVSTWVHPEDRQLVANATDPDYIRAKLSENKTYYINYRIISGGETQYLQLRVVNVGNNARISQIVIGYRRVDDEILHEMKQHKALQEALDQAKTANNTKDTFLSNMSHDMRTPLNAIFGYTALAKKYLDDASMVDSYLDKINVAGRQLLDMIEQILEISWMESKDIYLKESPCSLVDIMNEVRMTIQPQAEDKKITLHVDLSGLQQSDVYSDHEKLTQILLNLAGNAVKYTEANGRIDLIAARKEQLPNDHAVYQFTVQDTGIGISQDFLQHIFEPFQRERNTTFSGIYGTGLGLTIVKNVVETMNGTISADSTPGQGSTFTVTLTLRQQSSPSAPDGSIDHTHALLVGRKILLVDDNEINLEIETELLQELGFCIETAPDGLQAIEKLQASTPGEYAFILMDIQMPVMDGRKAAEAIRRLEDPVLSHIPIIALSANAFESDKRLSTESGMNAHLTKPIDVPILLETIARVVPADN